MSEKEIQKTEIMSQLAGKQITQRIGATRLGISIRQVKRLWRKYKDQGAEGLINKSRGKPSYNQLNEEVKKRVVDRILERYRDFGATLATEKLEELHGIKISDESVRKIMIEEGLWKQRRRKKSLSNAGAEGLFRRADSDSWFRL